MVNPMLIALWLLALSVFHVTEGNDFLRHFCHQGDNQGDCHALADLYFATGRGLQWANGSSLCTWERVTCDTSSTPRVLKL